MNAADFRAYQLPAPKYDDVAAEYGRIGDKLEAASAGGEAIAAVEKWDALRRRLSTWSQVALIRFSQDTRNEAYKNEREYRDELEPKLTNLAEPGCSAVERAAMWQAMEQTYLPTLDWGDLAHPASGRRWQAQLYLFTAPFYYIDYGLALVCAMQLWIRAAEDRDGAMASFGKLCRRGGEAPFGELLKSAGLTSPFDEGCLKCVVGHAKRVLNAG